MSKSDILASENEDMRGMIKEIKCCKCHCVNKSTKDFLIRKLKWFILLNEEKIDNYKGEYVK